MTDESGRVRVKFPWNRADSIAVVIDALLKQRNMQVLK